MPFPLSNADFFTIVARNFLEDDDEEIIFDYTKVYKKLDFKSGAIVMKTVPAKVLNTT